MKLESCPKLEHGRCVDPAATVERLEPLIAARHEYRLLEEKVADHLYWAALFLEEDPGFRAMGKGPTALRSKAGALAEAAEWLGALDTVNMPGYCTAHEEDLDNPLPIAELLTHVENATPSVLDRIRDLDRARHWVDGYSLIHQRTLKVPIEYVRQIQGPNGQAAGNRIEEAITHAALEVFERRAHITVLRNRMVVPTIDPGTIRHPVLREQLATLERRDIKVTLKDLSFGGALPCVGACFTDPHVSPEVQFHHFFKVGAGFDREEALLRVFTEYTQGRRAGEFGPGVEVEKIDFRRLPTHSGPVDNFLSAFMFGMMPFRDTDFLREGPVVPFNPGVRHDDCLGDINAALGIARDLGKDFIVIDRTDPGFGFPVVQVVIPGYSDILPYHPASSHALFSEWRRDDAMRALGAI